MMDGYHKSVLPKEVIEALNIAKDKWYLDATLGDGGYSLEILNMGGKVMGIDVDPEALERAGKRLRGEGFSDQDFYLVQGNFRDLKNLIQKQMDTDDFKFAGCVFDLGVSSLQLFDPERGFSFAKNGPLDMRMDPSLQIRAWDLVNNLSRKELYEIFKTLGEEKYSWDLAGALERARQIKPFETTLDVSQVVEKVVGIKKDKIHPATRVFQALRMVVNDELGALRDGLEQAKEIIEKNGFITVISFHSLEDRIVKSTFREWKHQGLGEILTPKPLVPTDEEIRQNPRSRSAKLRIFKRI
jgi:16S rRNA (cytosine1402-N4)-methyltransferase